MSLRQALGRFGGVPLDLHPAWMRVPYGARCIGMDMIAHAVDPDERTLPVEDDWMTSICSTLAIGGKDRRNAKENLGRLLEAGLLTLSERRVRVELVPVVQSTCAGRALDVLPPCAVSVPNNTQVTETKGLESLDRLERLDKKDERDAHARPDLLGFNWYCQTLSLIPTSAPSPGSWRDQYAFMGSKPDAERAKVAAEIQADEWCSANPHLVSPEHVRKHWQKYLGGAARTVLKPVVATPREQIEKARERLLDASKTLRMIEDLPWFDKERPNYPDRLTRARDAVAQARSEVAKVERGGAQAVAS